MRAIAAVCVLASASVAHAQLIDVQIGFSGSVNGGSVEGSGEGVIDADETGMSMASVTFSQLPASFDPLAPSLISNLCGNAFRDEGGTQNLFALAGGEYNVERTFQWIGFSGVLTVDSQVQNNKGTGGWVSDSVISGEYNGPTDIVGVQSYAITWLPSSTPGEFFESGTAVLERANGESLIMQFASIFSGLASDLEQPQFGFGEFDAGFDGKTLTLNWDGTFRVPAPGAVCLLAGAGLLAGRRRR